MNHWVLRAIFQYSTYEDCNTTTL